MLCLSIPSITPVVELNEISQLNLLQTLDTSILNLFILAVNVQRTEEAYIECLSRIQTLLALIHEVSTDDSGDGLVVESIVSDIVQQILCIVCLLILNLLLSSCFTRDDGHILLYLALISLVISLEGLAVFCDSHHISLTCDTLILLTIVLLIECEGKFELVSSILLIFSLIILNNEQLGEVGEVAVEDITEGSVENLSGTTCIVLRSQSVRTDFVEALITGVVCVPELVNSSSTIDHHLSSRSVDSSLTGCEYNIYIRPLLLIL